MTQATRDISLRRKGSQTRIEIRQGDCLAGLESLESGSVDLVVTSPPYNLGTRYHSYDDSTPRNDYLDWIDEWASRVTRVLAEDGSLFLNVGGKPQDPWVPLEVATRVRKHMNLQNMIHWVKSIAIEPGDVGGKTHLDHTLAVGHYKPINSPRYLNDCHEFVFHFTPTGRSPVDRLSLGVPYQDQSNASRWKSGSQGLRCRGNVWFVPYETIQHRAKERPHPATFPSRLPEMCIQLHGRERAGLVVDPFLGLGSSAVAAARLDVSFLGFEIEPSYVDVSVQRVRDELGLFAEVLSAEC